MVEKKGLEPSTLTLPVWCSSQLSYFPNCFVLLMYTVLRKLQFFFVLKNRFFQKYLPKQDLYGVSDKWISICCLRILAKKMVCPSRFERETFYSGGRRSIQLSYGHTIVYSFFTSKNQELWLQLWLHQIEPFCSLVKQPSLKERWIKYNTKKEKNQICFESIFLMLKTLRNASKRVITRRM